MNTNRHRFRKLENYVGKVVKYTWGRRKRGQQRHSCYALVLEWKGPTIQSNTSDGKRGPAPCPAMCHLGMELPVKTTAHHWLKETTATQLHYSFRPARKREIKGKTFWQPEKLPPA